MTQTYYGWHARLYNRLWRTFTARTHAAALHVIDFDAVRAIPTSTQRAARVLDVACGTGVLLCQILERVPESEVYGVDASADMLAQARALLGARANVTLALGTVGAGLTAHLPHPPGMFDLITCTNTLHYLPDPVATLRGLG